MSDEKKNDFTVTFSALEKLIISPSDHYLEADWQAVTLAPLWVFDAVARADKKDPDDKERAAFAAAIKAIPHAFFTAFVYANLRKNVDALTAVQRSAAREPLQALGEIDTLLRNYPKQHEAEEYRRDLVALAQTIAGASGGVLGLGSKVSDREAAVIGRIRAVLRVPASS